jgi:hypothetical protein
VPEMIVPNTHKKQQPRPSSRPLGGEREGGDRPRDGGFGRGPPGDRPGGFGRGRMGGEREGYRAGGGGKEPSSVSAEYLTEQSRSRIQTCRVLKCASTCGSYAQFARG